MSIIRRVANGASAFVIACSSLVTLAFPLTAYAEVQTCTWTGDAVAIPEVNHLAFSLPGNWANCNDGVPLAGDIIRFDNADVPAAPAEGTAPTVLTNDLNVALGGVETYLSTSDKYNVYIDTLKFADGAYFQATSAPAQGSSRLYLTVGTVAAGSTNVSSGPVTGLGSLDIKTTGLNYGSLTITGSLTAGDGVYISKSTTTFSGTLTLLNGAYLSVSANAATLDVTFPIVVGGGSGTDKPEIGIQGYQKYDSTTKKWSKESSTVTFSGNLTLNNDLDVMADSYNTLTTVKFTGTTTGSGKITRNENSVGVLITPSGELKNEVKTTALDGDVVSGSTGAYVTVQQNETATLNGKRESVSVQPGGVLKGGGTIVGYLGVNEGATVAPGNSPGCITSDELNLEGTYLFEIGGTEACTGYDQLKVLNASSQDDAVTIDDTSAVLTTSLYNNFAPKKDQVYVIIDQAGDKAVTGTFKDLPEGATFEQNGIVFKISYKGGTGNDVTLTVQSVPAVPDTGFAFNTAQPAVLLAVMTALSAAIVLSARRANKLKSARR